MKMKEIKEAAIEAAVSEIFATRYTTLVEEQATLAEDVWQKIYGEYAVALAKVPEGMLHTCTDISWANSKGHRFTVRFNGSFWVRYDLRRNPPHIDLLEKGLERKSKPYDSKSHSRPVLPSAFGKHYNVLREKYDALAEELRTFDGRLRASLSIVKSPKQLQKAWPEVGKYLPEGWDAAPVPTIIEEGAIGKMVKAAKK